MRVSLRATYLVEFSLLTEISTGHFRTQTAPDWPEVRSDTGTVGFFSSPTDTTSDSSRVICALRTGHRFRSIGNRPRRTVFAASGRDIRDDAFGLVGVYADIVIATAERAVLLIQKAVEWTMEQHNKRRVHPVDGHVGMRLKTLRQQRSMTQTDVANALGLTFQQVQKYERGANRMSASKLWDAARHFGVDVREFYQGLEPSSEPHRDNLPSTAARLTREAAEISRVSARLPVRKQKLALALIQEMRSAGA